MFCWENQEEQRFMMTEMFGEGKVTAKDEAKIAFGICWCD